MLRVQGVSKRYHLRPILDDVSFSINDGEVLGLIGPNGAGKTTLFECLTGLLPVDAGMVSDAQRELAPYERKQLLYYVADGIRPWPDQPLAWAAEFYERLFARPRGEGRRVLESVG